MPAFCTWGLGAIYGHNFEKFMKVSLQSEFKMTRNIGDGGDKFVKNESKASKGGKQECEKQKEQPVDPSHDMLSHRFGVCQPHADLMKAMIEIWTRGGAELLVADNVGDPVGDTVALPTVELTVGLPVGLEVGEAVVDRVGPAVGVAVSLPPPCDCPTPLCCFN